MGCLLRSSSRTHARARAACHLCVIFVLFVFLLTGTPENGLLRVTYRAGINRVRVAFFFFNGVLGLHTSDYFVGVCWLFGFVYLSRLFGVRPVSVI